MPATLCDDLLYHHRDRQGQILMAARQRIAGPCPVVSLRSSATPYRLGRHLDISDRAAALMLTVRMP